MLGDGLVPSNAKAGYLARMLARRILRMRDELGIDVSLSELIQHHLDVNMEGHDMKQTKDGLHNHGSRGRALPRSIEKRF